MVVPTPFVAATMAGIKDKLKPHQVCAFHHSLDTQAGGWLVQLSFPMSSSYKFLQHYACYDVKSIMCNMPIEVFRQASSRSRLLCRSLCPAPKAS